MDKEEQRINKIRARATYKEGIRYLQMAEKINISVRDEEAFLLLIHSLIDERQGYHSQKNSDYAEESIKQLCEDLRSGKVELEA